MAETIVGHVLPGELIHAGSLDAFRRQGGLMAAMPLAGRKVLEFSHTVMGPAAGRRSTKTSAARRST